MRPARMFRGIWERKLTLCGEPTVSPVFQVFYDVAPFRRQP